MTDIKISRVKEIRYEIFHNGGQSVGQALILPHYSRTVTLGGELKGFFNCCILKELRKAIIDCAI